MILVDRLAAFVHTVLRQTGLNEEDARVTTEVLITTDTWGVFTHGTKNLRGYVRRLRGGGLRARGRPRVMSEGPAWALVDADSTVGMPRSTFAARVQQIIEEIRSAPKAKGADRIYLPGEMEWEKRERALREGLALSEDVLEKLRQLAKEEQVVVNGLFG